jgi:hypothetical protein
VRRAAWQMNMEYKQVKVALFVVWIVLSGIILTILIVSFLLPAASVNAIVPKCEWKIKFNKPCPLCGMTTSFLAISRGRFKEADAANGLGIYLFSLFVSNEIVLTALLLFKKAVKNRLQRGSFLEKN